MKKIALAIVLVAFSAVYIQFFVQLPKIDYAHSDYAVVCTKLSGVYGFHIDPGLITAVEAETFRQNGYEVNDKFYDVFLKVKCAKGSQSAEDTQKLLATVQADYDNGAIPESFINGPVNYTIKIENAIYRPSYTEFILKIVLLLGIIIGTTVMVRKW